jgi:ankyrin repeat protein
MNDLQLLRQFVVVDPLKEKSERIVFDAIGTDVSDAVFSALVKFEEVRSPYVLAKAAAADDARFLRALLSAGASAMTKTYDGDTLLHLARRGSVVRLLLEHGADSSVVGRNKLTPLMQLCGANEFYEHLNLSASKSNQKKVDLDAIAALLDGGDLALDVVDTNGNTALHFALFNAKGRCDRRAQMLIAAGASISVANRDNVTPTCCMLRVVPSAAIIRSLLFAGAPARCRFEENGYTFCHAAVLLGDVGLVKEVIDRGADLNDLDLDGFTPLMVAAGMENADLEIISVLLAAGAELRTALFFSKRHDVAEALIDAGATVNDDDADGTTLLMRAVCSGDLDMLAALIAAGAQLDRCRAKDGSTALHLAVAATIADMAELLIAADADVNVVNEAGVTPLMLAAEQSDFNIVSLLLVAGARKSVNAARLSDGATALHLALRSDIADALLDAGADVNEKDLAGWTPAHYAVAIGDIGCLRRLIAAGADVGSATATGDTLLHIAVATPTSDDAIIRALVDAGGDVNAANHAGRTVCHAAASNLIVLRTMIELGAHCDRLDSQSMSPISLAVQTNLQCVNELLNAGADATRSDANGCTLLHLCLSRLHPSIASPALIRALVARGADAHALTHDSGENATFAAARLGKLDCIRTLLALGARPQRSQPLSLTTKQMYYPIAALVLVVGECDNIGMYLQTDELSPQCWKRARLTFVQARGGEICIGLQSLRLDALQLCEIMLQACAPDAELIPFRCLWAIAVKVKHFK